MLLGIYLFFAHVSAWAYEAEDFTYYNYAATGSSYEIGGNSKKPLTIDGLYDAIRSVESPSIETVLPELKKRDPSMFSEYILMYGSRSLQGSSFQSPRALLVTKHAELIVSFNGESSQKGFHQLEVMFFDKKKNNFNFQEISFLDGKASFSEINPKKCLACHQSPHRAGVDPRPNWEPYNVWPGAYNSVSHISEVTNPSYKAGAHHLADGTKEDSPPMGSRYNHFLAQQLAREEEEADQFVRVTSPNHPRYKHLTPLTQFNWAGIPNYFDNIPVGKFPNNMPVRLTQSLAYLNARRLGRMIQSDYPVIFEKYKYAILTAAQCGKLPLPPQKMLWHQQQLRKNFVPEDQILQKPAFAKIEMAFDFIFKAYGVDTADWSMDFNTNGSFAMSAKFGIPGGTSLTNEALAGGLQEVWQIPEFKNGKDKECASLVAKSLEVLNTNSAQDLHYADLSSAKQPLLNRCIECHQTYMVGPYIPFDNPSELKQALTKNNSALYNKIQYRLGLFPAFNDAMPPQGYVTQEQKTEVLKYIDEIYNQ